MASFSLVLSLSSALCLSARRHPTHPAMPAPPPLCYTRHRWLAILVLAGAACASLASGRTWRAAFGLASSDTHSDPSVSSTHLHQHHQGGHGGHHRHSHDHHPIPSSSYFESSLKRMSPCDDPSLCNNMPCVLTTSSWIFFFFFFFFALLS